MPAQVNVCQLSQCTGLPVCDEALQSACSSRSSPCQMKRRASWKRTGPADAACLEHYPRAHLDDFLPEERNLSVLVLAMAVAIVVVVKCILLVENLRSLHRKCSPRVLEREAVLAMAINFVAGPTTFGLSKMFQKRACSLADMTSLQTHRGIYHRTKSVRTRKHRFPSHYNKQAGEHDNVSNPRRLKSVTAYSSVLIG